MKDKPLVSIAILTYNRASCLENLLNNVMPQVKELNGLVNVCISNNASTDNTREVVAGFQQKYPDLITYHENEKNLGVDKNIIKAMELATGEFIWTFADDDLIVPGGLREVVDFIKSIDKKNTGLVILRTESYLVDKTTGQKMVYYNSFDKNKPEIFQIPREEIIGLSFPAMAFISVLIYNNEMIKKIFDQDKEAVEASNGTHHAHLPLCVFMFLKYPQVKALALNTHPIVTAGIAPYKVFIEDKFMLHYQVQKKLDALLLSYKHIDEDSARLITENDKKLRKGFIIDMLVVRAFRNFDYLSYLGCLKLFFREAPFIDALIFSFVFSLLFLIPPAVLTGMYKILLMARYKKEWKVKWNIVNSVASIKGGGTRRRNDLVD